MLVKDSLWGEL